MTFKVLADAVDEKLAAIALLLAQVEQGGGTVDLPSLARHLMARLVDWGRSRGLKRISGQVLADNTGMLRFVRVIGFETRRTEDPEILEAYLTLEE